MLYVCVFIRLFPSKKEETHCTSILNAVFISIFLSLSFPHLKVPMSFPHVYVPCDAHIPSCIEYTL